MSYDYEHAELERKIRDLERKVDDLEYEMSRLRDDKADRYHTHDREV